jgi:hypothetical protein
VISDLGERTFCYAYDGFHSFNETTYQVLRENRRDYALNVEQRDANAEDFRSARLALQRFDCIEFPFGKIRAITAS